MLKNFISKIFCLNKTTKKFNNPVEEYKEEKLDDRQIIRTKFFADYDDVLRTLEYNKQFGKLFAMNEDKFVSEHFKDDKEIVKIAVYLKPNALQYASDRLKDDPDIVLTAFQRSTQALEFASDRLKENYEFMFSCVKERGYAFKYCSKELKNCKEIALIAIRHDREFIQFASEEIQNLCQDKDQVETLEKIINAVNLYTELNKNFSQPIEIVEPIEQIPIKKVKKI